MGSAAAERYPLGSHSNLTDVDWDAIAALSAAGSAAFAGWQLYQSRRESMLRTTFEHLREIERRVQALRHLPVGELCQKAKEAYATGSQPDPDTLTYLALLDGLELLATARRVKAVDRALVDEFLSPILRKDLVTTTLLQEIRSCWEDAHIYADLGKLLLSLERPRRRVLRRLQEHS